MGGSVRPSLRRTGAHFVLVLNEEFNEETTAVFLVSTRRCRPPLASAGANVRSADMTAGDGGCALKCYSGHEAKD